MTEYYAIIDNAIDADNLSVRLYKFNPEISLKPLRISKNCCVSMEMIVNNIEISFNSREDCKYYILADDVFLRNLLDNNIKDFSHIEIVYNKASGYRVFYNSHDYEIDNVIIELLDVSSCGIFKYIRKLKNI